MPEGPFDEKIARSYSVKWPHLFEPELVDATVGFLASLAGTGPVLELGVGTGRIAIPLSRRGVTVHGVELSPPMVNVLREQRGADAVAVTIGDFATVKVDARFSLAYLIRNTICNLTTQDEQVACFCNVAAHLAPGGRFVIENYIPELQHLPPGETVHPFDITPHHLGFEEYDLSTEIAVSHHYWFVDGEVETFAAPFRYVWPSELDLMASIAGMRLSERWEDWARRPFTSQSRSRVSVWELSG